MDGWPQLTKLWEIKEPKMQDNFPTGIDKLVFPQKNNFYPRREKA